MLGHFDEVLLEQYIISENMSKIERDICMLYITNIKDICDSDIETNNRKFSISNLRLKKDGACIFFEGEVFNDEESRDIMGSLTKTGKSMKVECVFFRRGFNQSYRTIDLFKSANSSVIRRSTYINNKRHFEDLVNLNINDLNSLYEKRIMHLKRV